MTRFATFVGLVALIPVALVSAQPPLPNGVSNWAFDELTVKNGSKFQGLIQFESAEGIMFRSVSHLPGRPTITFTSFFTNQEIVTRKRLSDAERAILKERLAELDPRGEGEGKRMASLELETTDEWPKKSASAKKYKSEHFTLTSTGSEELTRRSAVRLEQIYTAFTRILPPPTVKDVGPTTVMLATDNEEYRILLGPLGAPGLLNPAVFDPLSNSIYCGSDLKRLGSDLQSARFHHSQQIATLDRYEASVKKLYKGQPELKQLLETVKGERNRVLAADWANGTKFDQATARLFATLYHEAFHAYVGTFVYPPLKPDDVKAGKGTGELPRWLNEGLAQVFETAVVEAGELRADTPNPDRLARVKNCLKGKGGTDALVPLSDLLITDKDAFLTSHADEKARINRAYLTSWALAYYLTFERRTIGTAEFRKYLVAVNSGTNPRQAFTELVGRDLLAFEKDWHAYLLKLQTDGTVGK